MPPENDPKPAAAKAADADEPTYTAERILASAGDFAKASGHEVRRGTIAGMLVMLGNPKRMTRAEVLAGLKAYLAKEA